MDPSPRPNEPAARTSARGAPTDARLVEVARMHYELGMTHREIAEALGVSRVRVTRMLAEARSRGIVDIRIHGDATPFSDVADALAKRFRLSRAWVGPTFAEEVRTSASVASVGAVAIGEVLSDATVVTIGLSKTVARALQELTPLARPQALFVPMAGGWPGPAEGLNPEELTAQLAQLTGGRSYNMLAPLLAGSAATATSLRQDAGIAASLERAGAADTLITGVGGMRWTESALADAVTPQEREQLRARAAIGDTCARFFDAHGRPVETSLDERVVGLTLHQMAQIPTRVVIAHGRHKVDALRGALAASLATVLVTDLATARSLLDDTLEDIPPST